MHKSEVLKKFGELRDGLSVALPAHAEVHMRLFVYECLRLIKGPSIDDQYAKQALSLVTLKDKHKFQIVVNTLDLLMNESEDIDDVKRFIFNTLSLLKELQKEAFHECYVDKLTGLWNYNYLKKLENEISDKAFTLYFFDLDNLKQKNDTFGHEFGNRLITDFSNILRNSFRAEDIVVRYGGDEFLAIVFRSNGQPNRLIEKIKSNAQIREENIEFSVGFSNNTMKSLTKTIALADQLMYLDKDKK